MLEASATHPEWFNVCRHGGSPLLFGPRFTDTHGVAAGGRDRSHLALPTMNLSDTRGDDRGSGFTMNVSEHGPLAIDHLDAPEDRMGVECERHLKFSGPRRCGLFLPAAVE
jgi:hypothetical protein